MVSNYEIGKNVSDDGKPMRVEIRATNTFRKEGGKWKMIRSVTQVDHRADPGLDIVARRAPGLATRQDGGPLPLGGQGARQVMEVRSASGGASPSAYSICDGT